MKLLALTKSLYLSSFVSMAIATTMDLDPDPDPGSELDVDLSTGELRGFTGEQEKLGQGLDLDLDPEQELQFAQSLFGQNLFDGGTGESTTALKSRRQKDPPANYKQCTRARKKRLEDARGIAIYEATAALQDISNIQVWGSSIDCPRYEKWFGSFDQSRHETLTLNVITVTRLLLEESITFHCNPPFGTCPQYWVRAAYYQSGLLERKTGIYLCDGYWEDSSWNAIQVRWMIRELLHPYTFDGDVISYFIVNSDELACDPHVVSSSPSSPPSSSPTMSPSSLPSLPPSSLPSLSPTPFPPAKNDVSLTLSVSKTVFKADEPISVNVVLKSNDVDKPANILEWFIPCDFPDRLSDMSLFDIKTTGDHEANYRGVRFVRSEPTEEDYKVLKPGEQISCIIDLDKYYDFSASEYYVYEIKYSKTSMQLSHPGLNGTNSENNEFSTEILESNSLTLKIHPREKSVITSEFGDPVTCVDDSFLSSAQDAKDLAVDRLDKAVELIDRVGHWESAQNCPQYTLWFGDYDSNHHAIIQTRFRKFLEKLRNKISFNCHVGGTPPNIVAYFFTNQPHELFFNGPTFYFRDDSSRTDAIILSMVYSAVITENYVYGKELSKILTVEKPYVALNNAENYLFFVNENFRKCKAPPHPSPFPTISGSPTKYPTLYPTQYPTSSPTQPPSCMSGNTRVHFETKIRDKPNTNVRGDRMRANSQFNFKEVRDLIVGDKIQGLDENLNPTTCIIEAVGHFGSGPVYGNYTMNHFILDNSGETVLPHGTGGELEVIDKYAVLTSCPVGVDESGVGFTAVDSDLLGNHPLSWSDYIVIHESIVNIVKDVGPFVFSPSTYSSMETVKLYTNKLFRTMLKCAREHTSCDSFEMAAKDLYENSLTREARKKVKARFPDLGRASKRGSISATVSKGRSVRD